MSLIQLSFTLKSRTGNFIIVVYIQSFVSNTCIEEKLFHFQEQELDQKLYKQPTFLFSFTHLQEDMNSFNRIKRAFISSTQRKKQHSFQPLENAYQYEIMLPSTLPELTQEQDNTIRHLSLLYLNNIDESVIQELLEYKRNSLWGKLKVHMNGTPEVQTNTELGSDNNRNIIGVSLSNISSGTLSQHSTATNTISFEKWVASSPPIQSCFSSNSMVPNFLRDCILAIVDQDLNTEGIFRKNGNIRGIREMCETINASPDREDWFDYFREQPVIQLTAFIKKFLRELPEPLLSKRLHKLLMSASRATQANEAVAMIHYTMCLLPKQNRDILLVILGLLNLIERYSGRNMMHYGNLATVIAPSLLYCKNDEAICGDVSEEIHIVALMIERYEQLIMVRIATGKQ